MANRIQVIISDSAWRKLMAEQRRQTRAGGRGKSYPLWKIVQDLLMTLPDPEVEDEPVKEAVYAHR